MPEDKTRVWTVRELMKSAMEHLQLKGFEDARLNVELLLAHALDLQRIQLYLHFDKPLTPEERCSGNCPPPPPSTRSNPRLKRSSNKGR